MRVPRIPVLAAVTLALAASAVPASAAPAPPVAQLAFLRSLDRGVAPMTIGVDGRGLRWLAGLDSSPTRSDEGLDGGDAYRRSPDFRGRVLISTSRYGSALAVEYDGRRLFFESTTDPTWYGSWEWASDSSAIALTVTDGLGDAPVTVIIETASGARRDVPGTGGDLIRWAPDGRRVVLVAATHLTVLARDGAAAGAADLPAGATLDDLVVTRSGGLVGVLTASGSHRVAAIPIDGGAPTTLVDGGEEVEAAAGSDRLLVRVGAELLSTDAAGGARTSLARDVAGPVVASPWTPVVAFGRAEGGIARVGLDGRGLRRLTTRAGDVPLRFLSTTAPPADTTPPRARVLGREGRRAIVGSVVDADSFSAGVRGVRVRVLRVQARGCVVWTGRRFRAAGCASRGAGLPAQLVPGPNGPRWRLPVALAPGRYRVVAVATDGAGRVDPRPATVALRVGP